jgi:class 3 adenylate cyclase
VILVYQDACKAAIDAFDGFVACYMGDGILAYFGYPRAHEDDAERAVRVGLEVVDAVSALDPQPELQLQVRVGIATGLVVAGDIEMDPETWTVP